MIGKETDKNVGRCVVMQTTTYCEWHDARTKEKPGRPLVDMPRMTLGLAATAAEGSGIGRNAASSSEASLQPGTTRPVFGGAEG